MLTLRKCLHYHGDVKWNTNKLKSLSLPLRVLTVVRSIVLLTGILRIVVKNAVKRLMCGFQGSMENNEGLGRLRV